VSAREGVEYEEVTDTGIVLRERRAGYSTHEYDFNDATVAQREFWGHPCEGCA